MAALQQYCHGSMYDRAESIQDVTSVSVEALQCFFFSLWKVVNLLWDIIPG